MAALTDIKLDWLQRGIHKNTAWIIKRLLHRLPSLTQFVFSYLHILISIAASQEWPLKQFDVKNVFLNGDLEEVFMDLPPGVQCKSETRSKVCHLKKSLYGLKQSPRAWFGRFSSAMIAFNYKQSNADHTLFIKHQNGKVTAFII